MKDHPLHRIMHPHSVAFYGASNNILKMGSMLMANLLASGFQGGIYPVHLREERVMNLPAYHRAQEIPDPADYFGFELGEDRKLADWDQLMGWYELLASRSNRVILDTLGETTLGVPFLMLTVTSPETARGISADLVGLALALGAERLVSFAPECVAQLRAAAGDRLRVVDALTVLCEAVRGESAA